MSLIFVGYETEKFDFNKFKLVDDAQDVKTEPYIADKGIFAISDSTITTNS
jgi:hypothetical protein